MLATVIISIFVFFIVLIIFLEYRNEKKYQEKRRQSRENQTRNRRTPPSQEPRKAPPKPEPSPKVEPAVKPKPTVEVKPEPKPEPEVKPKPEPVVEVKSKPEPKPEIKVEPKPEPKIEIPKEEVKEAKELPEANYPPFTHVRLVEMGLSDDEAKEFVGELIPQLEEQIPLIEEALNGSDFHQMERLTHSIKGSATNIGTGGVSDLLVDCNTYFKTGTDIDVAEAYFKHLKHYTQELKEQYA